jgi:hypothetical protein
VNCPKCGQPFKLGAGVDRESEDSGQRNALVRSQDDERRVKPSPGTQYSVLSTKADPQAAAPPTQRPVPHAPVPASRLPIPASRPPPLSPPPRRTAAPDNLVDPNLLPPPPPRAKPKLTEVPVVCYLCGTRLYAPLDKIGKKFKCPDCHAINKIEAPKESEQPQPAGPTLENAPEFALSDPGQRPRYRPLVAPRGEYEILSALDPATVTHGWTLPDAALAATDAEEEVQLAAPVERVALPREPIKLPEPDPEEALYDGRYDDGLIGDNVDPRHPDAWKRAPFVYGIVEFLFQPGTLSRLVLYSVGLAILVNLVGLTVDSATGEDPTWKVLALILTMWSMVAMGLWLGPFSACCLAIVQDTANGAKEVGNWPDWNPTEFFYSALFCPVAALISGLPGMVITTVLFSTGLDPRIAAFTLSLPLPLSWLILFPVVLYSMLAESSLLGLLSKHTLRSLQSAGAAWVLFYMYSIVILLFVAFAGSLVLAQHVALRALGAPFLVVLAFLYARLLGRLMWYAAQQEAKLQPRHSTGVAGS